jgi:putative membrane protein
MLRVLSLLAMFVIVLGSINARSDDEKKTGDKAFDDGEFVKKAASSGMHEVELGKIAEEKAMTSLVKAFAERMVTDHSKAIEDLRLAARAAGLTVPDKMNEQHQKEVERFKNYKGNEFDREYLKHMLSDHEKDVELFTQASKEAKSSAIKDFAAKTLPTVEDHLKVVRKILPKE